MLVASLSSRRAPLRPDSDQGCTLRTIRTSSDRLPACIFDIRLAR